MANPTPLSHTTPYARPTVLDLKKYVARALGIDYTEFTTNEDALFLDELNKELNEWRILVASTKPWGQFVYTYEWGGAGAYDPANGDNIVELPDDFSAVAEPKLYYVNSDGEILRPIQLIERQKFDEGWYEGEAVRWDVDNSIAYIYQESDNRRRMLRVYPDPADGSYIRLNYLALAEKLTADGDTIEAPAEVADGIKYGITARWAEIDGDDNAIARFEARRQQKIKLFSGLRADEDKVGKFVRPFDGYPGEDTPSHGQTTNPRWWRSDW